MAMTNECIFQPPLSTTRKDHKDIPRHLEEFGSPSRPISDGNKAPNTQFSQVMATIFKKAAYALQNPYQCVGTEEMLKAIDEEDSSHCDDQTCISIDASNSFISQLKI